MKVLLPASQNCQLFTCAWIDGTMERRVTVRGDPVLPTNVLEREQMGLGPFSKQKEAGE